MGLYSSTFLWYWDSSFGQVNHNQDELSLGNFSQITRGSPNQGGGFYRR
jgi:hypothetical protein